MLIEGSGLPNESHPAPTQGEFSANQKFELSGSQNNGSELMFPSPGQRVSWISQKLIKGADKLWKLTLDVGMIGERIVCAGIKEYYSKDELKGKKVILFLNLAPRKMRGVESQGMILAAGNKETNTCVLISPEKDIELGTRIS